MLVKFPMQTSPEVRAFRELLVSLLLTLFRKLDLNAKITLGAYK